MTSLIINISENKPKSFTPDPTSGSFFHFYPSKITLQQIYTKGAFPLNSEHMGDIIQYFRGVFDHNCRDDAELVIFIISDPNHYLLRQDIRETYGKNHVNYKYSFSKKPAKNLSHCLLFSIGYRDDIAVNQQVDYEAYTYKDIIRIPVLDAYRETAHKIIFTLYLLGRMNHSFEYVLKTDDDIFLKINKIIPHIHSLDKEQVFIGHRVVGAIPIRDKMHKWYVSEEDYPYGVYDPYMMGSCYILRRSIIQNVSIAHYHTPMIPMEDIHISYLVSGLGYNLTNSHRYFYCINIFSCQNSYIIDISRDLHKRKSLFRNLQADVVHDGDDLTF
ncbi:Beta-1,3-galactosyltransferase 1 [Thelohanellus kitauei]|uniref:Hexosyltransferase n=1 Tax=Thelohanellus kitauei TaxID=669202 RepID=A0A0C2NCM8_THEKT|nr:Beta-1,3-galactosyltransferase 1 [Thelohanellus kitauei]